MRPINWTIKKNLIQPNPNKQSPELFPKYRITSGVFFIVALLILLYSFVFSDNQPVPCIRKIISGKECSSCGLSRGFSSMVHGRWQERLHFSRFVPLFVFVVLQLCWRAIHFFLYRRFLFFSSRKCMVLDIMVSILFFSFAAYNLWDKG